MIGIPILVLFLVLVTWHYGIFVATLCKWSQKPRVSKKGKLVYPEIEVSDKVQCFVPLWQVTMVQKALYRKCSISRILTIVVYVIIALRAINVFLLPISGEVLIVTTFALYFALVIWILMYAFITANCSRMFSFGFLVTLLNFLMPYVFCFYLKTNIPKIMMEMRKEDTFKDGSDTLIIKRKSGK